MEQKQFVDVDFDNLLSGVKDYEKGIGKGGRARASVMSAYRETLIQLFKHAESVGVTEMEASAIVRKLADVFLGGDYRRSYNYLNDCAKKGHIPPHWKSEGKEEGKKLKTFIYVGEQPPEDEVEE